ncbi:hypothetical protein [Reichenbachiella ulvae]|uniref:Uncharacterized protein n=1 Tax=Reichenbachiella ulvae TaxID=2980104 RepID=A0ABT3CN45_9BACT|nr:hypothetical protein [Reichenbachiella ulvae]MCV9385120.1 hypothetical protein [Reichenbachiella ulvae]
MKNFVFLVLILLLFSCEESAIDNIDQKFLDKSLTIVDNPKMYDDISEGDRKGLWYEINSVQRVEDSLILELRFAGCDPNHSFVIVEGTNTEESLSLALIHQAPNQLCEALWVEELGIDLGQFRSNDSNEFTVKLTNGYDLKEYVLPPNVPGLIQGKQIEVEVARTYCQPGPNGLWFQSKRPNNINPDYKRFSFLPLEFEGELEIEEGQSYLIDIEVLPWSALPDVATCYMYEGPFLPVKIVDYSEL